jgi:hypothetical protein
MADSENALTAGTINRDRYESVIEFYTGHLQRAEDHLKAARESEGHKRTGLEHELRATRNRQVALTDAVANGEMDRGEANEQNRHYTRAISELRYAIDVASQNVDATSAEELGGYIDLPLDKYIAAPSVAAAQREAAPQSSKAGALIAVGVALAIFVMGLAALGVLPGSANVEIHAEPIGAYGEFIEITFRNESTKYAFFYTPWPEGPKSDRNGAAFGVEVYVMERDSEAFRFLPSSPGCWTSGGVGIVREEPFAVEPGISLPIVMDPSNLKTLGINATRLRLVFTRSNGAEAGRFEYTLNR